MKNRVLVIEDEKDLVAIITFRLNEAGYETLVAADGLDGYEKAKKEQPDIIILDLMLPKMDGYKICKLLKSDARYKKIPIIVFTARAQEADRKMSEEVGADAYITKPFEAEVLINAIKELLNK